MPRLDENAKGVFIIAATPFTETGALDLPSIDRMVEWYLERGVHGMTILGQMGEAPKLTAEESARFARRVLARVDDRVPVIVGVSSPGFATMEALSHAVLDGGAAGMMVAPPATLKGDDAILGYCTHVSRLIGDASWVLQDFPLSGTPPMSALLIRRIAEACPSCVMLKHEDWPGLDKISALRRLEEQGGRRLSILTGNGGIFLPHELLRGADGAMTGFAFPEMLLGVYGLIVKGRRDEALDLFDAYLPLVRYEQQPGLGLVVRKYVLHRRGALASPRIRAPGPALSEETRQEVDWLMTRLERLIASHGMQRRRH
jgi:4-hydroxy-tetrahydrodipicolinate synthase